MLFMWKNYIGAQDAPIKLFFPFESLVSVEYWVNCLSFKGFLSYFVYLSTVLCLIFLGKGVLVWECCDRKIWTRFRKPINHSNQQQNFRGEVNLKNKSLIKRQIYCFFFVFFKFRPALHSIPCLCLYCWT